MFNYNLNWDKIIKENIPAFLHLIFRLTWIKAMIAPAKQMYSEFQALRTAYIYKVRFNGQVCYLETILNNTFSPTSGGIYISNAAPTDKYYIYRQSESQPPIYLYKRWNPAVNYVIDHFSVEGLKVYKALAANTNMQPSASPAQWQYHKDVTILRKRSEFNLQFDFIVNVPVSVSFSTTQMRALIDYYRLAGRRYKIILY